MIDTIKAVFTYITASATALGGMVAIFLTRSDPSASDTRVVLAGFVGGAFAFLFGQEVATRTARQAQASTQAAADVTAKIANATNGNGH